MIVTLVSAAEKGGLWVRVVLGFIASVGQPGKGGGKEGEPGGERGRKLGRGAGRLNLRFYILPTVLAMFPNLYFLILEAPRDLKLQAFSCLQVPR